MKSELSIYPIFLRGVISIFFISFLLRGIFLGAIDQVVFDEVHFGKFISSYCCTGERFFDIHPPIGKLIIAGGAYLSGYSGDYPFTSIGEQYGTTPISSIRMVSAVAGSILAVMIFILLIQTGTSFIISFLGALAVAFDNALIVESRFIITDSILLAATFGALACAFACIRATSSSHSFLWAITAGAMSGIAVGTKFTGLVGGALVCTLLMYRMYQAGSKGFITWSMRILIAVIVGALVYLGGWVLHFSLLTMPGSGDAWGIPTGIFWEDLITTHQQMVSANYNLTADHPYGSKWWAWPFMVRSVFYWQGEGNQFMYLLGNPVVWWGSFFLFCLGVFTLFFYSASGTWSRLSSLFSSGAWIFLLGYIVSFVPLMRVPRVLFLYHYLTPLLFSLLFAVWMLDKTLKQKKLFVCAAITGIVLGFIFVSPVTYGIQFSDFWYKVLFTFSSWR